MPSDTPPPPSDSLGKRLSIIRHAPNAIGLDKEWTKGVPDRWPAVGAFLKENTGHDFPLLSRLRHKRVIRALATMIRDNFMETVIGKDQKLGAGLIYAEAVKSNELTQALRDAGAKPLDDSPENRAVKQLGEPLAPSPTTVNEDVIAACKDLAPQAIVEVVTFVSLLQMLHRIEAYYLA